MARKPLIAGNWKMNGSLEASRALVDGIVAGYSSTSPADLLVCPPAPYLVPAHNWLGQSGVMLGAQNVCNKVGSGAYTGEMSGAMLTDVGCSHVLVGHSERRSYYAESDVVVAEKFIAAQAAGLIPVLCVGETLEEREADTTDTVVTRQIEAVISTAGIAAFAQAVIAYEPVWAIGTGMTASPTQAQEVHALIRGLIAARDATIAAGLLVLYGGSMKPANAAELLAMDDIDGGLIGGASLDAEQFLGICRAAAG